MVLHTTAFYSPTSVIKDCIHPLYHIIIWGARIKLLLGCDMTPRIFPEMVFSRIRSMLQKKQPAFSSTKKMWFVLTGSVFQLLQITLCDHLILTNC